MCSTNKINLQWAQTWQISKLSRNFSFIGHMKGDRIKTDHKIGQTNLPDTAWQYLSVEGGSKAKANFLEEVFNLCC